jgi:hypothetical protein
LTNVLDRFKPVGLRRPEQQSFARIVSSIQIHPKRGKPFTVPA